MESTGNTKATTVPVFQEYMNPILACLRSAPEPRWIDSLNDAVANSMGLSTGVLGVLHDPDKSEQPEPTIAWRGPAHTSKR